MVQEKLISHSYEYQDNRKQGVFEELAHSGLENESGHPKSQRVSSELAWPLGSLTVSGSPCLSDRHLLFRLSDRQLSYASGKLPLQSPQSNTQQQK